jgi:hypothetical protein
MMANVPPKQAPAACFGAVGKATIVLKPSSTAKPMDGNAATNEISPFPLVA